MDNRIRVLIADDQVIAREGIRRILERENDIEIIGAVGTAPEVLPQVCNSRPNVLLLDLKWHNDDKAMQGVIAQLRREHPDTCIVGLTAFKDLVQQAREAGATWVITKDVSKDDLVDLVRAASKSVGPRELQSVRSALAHIHSLETGKGAAASYEEKVYHTLEALLYPHLTNPRFQTETMSGSHRRDILFSNYSSHPFWQRIAQRHDSTVIVFEVKNVKKLHVRYVDQVVGYLTSGLGRLGFIVARTPAGGPMLRRAVQVFKDSRKVVLFLCGDDLEEMLKLRERGDEATKLIMQRYDDFIDLT